MFVQIEVSFTGFQWAIAIYFHGKADIIFIGNMVVFKTLCYRKNSAKTHKQ